MGPKAQQARERIIEAADSLFYTQGFEKTSFSDIADTVQISRGNFYYHFKTKDEILDAVIQRRLVNTTNMIEGWEQAADTPADRLRRFIYMMADNCSDIKRYGCPVGTLCSELIKLGHASRNDANRLFTLFRHWLSRQFSLLGFEDADQLAMHLLARSQGIATLSSAFEDEKFIRQEVKQLDDWLSKQLEQTKKDR